MGSLKQNKASIAIYLPPTTDAWFFHCLRVSRQVQIWLQAPDGYIMYPEMNTIGFETIDGTTRIRWTSKPSLLNDPELSCCGKHKGACVKCICIRSQLPCTIFCQCSIDCPNRLINRTSSSESQRLVVSSWRYHAQIHHLRYSYILRLERINRQRRLLVINHSLQIKWLTMKVPMSRCQTRHHCQTEILSIIRWIRVM